MKLESLISVLDVVSVDGKCASDIAGVADNSRHVRPGYIFVAIPGYRVDGITYVDEALRRGAVAVVLEGALSRWRSKNPGPGKRLPACFIQVADARLALARLAGRFFCYPSRKLTMVGVTGTNGKTTTATLVRDMLAAAGRLPGLLTTIRYDIGERSIPAVRTTPSAPELQEMLAQMLRSGCQTAVMEVSSHALHQKRVCGIEFDVAVFTNLTRDHLDYHGLMEDYFGAKKKLFSAQQLRSQKSVCIINMDDEWGRRLAGEDELGGACLTFGTDGSADVRAEHIRLGPAGTKFRLVSPWGEADVRSKLLGRFNVSNALGALAVCGHLGVPPAEAAATLAETRRVPGRLEEVPNRLGLHVFVDYAHTDDALQNVLGTLRELAGKRVIAVFGCGGDRDVSKRPAMARVAERLADFSIVTSDNPRSEPPAEILKDIERGFARSGSHVVLEDRKEAILRAIQMAQAGDVILVAGKGHEKFQEFAHNTVPFDDVLVAKTAMDEMAGDAA